MKFVPDSVRGECPVCLVVHQACPCGNCKNGSPEGQVVGCSGCLSILLVDKEGRLGVIEREDYDHLSTEHREAFDALAQMLMPQRALRELMRTLAIESTFADVEAGKGSNEFKQR